MHIHGAHLSSYSSMGSAHGLTAAMSKRRAEEARKKLFASASELEASASAESSWMIGAWSGSQSGSQSESQSNPQSTQQSGANDDSSSAKTEPVRQVAQPKAVSFWV